MQMAALRVDDDLRHETAGAMTSMIRNVLDRDPATKSYVDDVAALERKYPPALRENNVR
jgi:hypothetical protein